LSNAIKKIKEDISSIVTKLEASIDFPDEVEREKLEVVQMELDRLISNIKELIITENEGRIMKEGIRVAIIGKPNVGKSSLLNALLKAERAIVTHLPGTTRDTIEEVVNIKGYPFILIDTAGLGSPLDQADEFGQERARKEAEGADVAILVIDGSSELTSEDDELLKDYRNGLHLIALNKMDIGIKQINNKELSGAVKVSALNGEGIPRLEDALLSMVLKQGPCLSAETSINARHKQLLVRAQGHLLNAKDSCKMGEEEPVLIDLRAALREIGELSGEQVSDEIIDSIFNQFCVGK
jgi:tRNA modification GTPase